MVLLSQRFTDTRTEKVFGALIKKVEKNLASILRCKKIWNSCISASENSGLM